MVLVLETERLQLRGWSKLDADDLAAMNADAQVMRFFPNVLSRVESDAGLARLMTLEKRDKMTFWAAELKENNSFIGFVGLKRVGDEMGFAPAVEIGWRLKSEYWGQGFAPEAALACLDYGFNQFDLDEIISFTPVQNEPSRRVMEKIGMQHDPSRDFDHPLLDDDSPLKRHVLYSIRRSALVV